MVIFHSYVKLPEGNEGFHGKNAEIIGYNTRIHGDIWG
jgi:hypothetical protein